MIATVTYIQRIDPNDTNYELSIYRVSCSRELIGTTGQGVAALDFMGDSLHHYYSSMFAEKPLGTKLMDFVYNSTKRFMHGKTNDGLIRKQGWVDGGSEDPK